ncbi:Ku protein [Streptomyces griseoincarnatus]
MSITFGLVSIPVSVHAATEPHPVTLRQVHAKDGSRIRLRRFCEAEGVEVPYSDVARGFEAPDGRVVVLTDADLADLPLPTARSIEVLGFVPAETVDPVALDRAYYLGASGLEGRPYVLLREALSESGLVGIARTALRTRESLAVLRVRDDVLCLQGLLWPDEIRPTTGLAPDAPAPRRQELRMARTLMDQLTEDFRWEEQHDEYRKALERVVAAKLEGTEPPHAPAAQVMAGRVVDLMAMLEASVQAAREAHAEPSPGPGQTTKKSAAKPGRRRSS